MMLYQRKSNLRMTEDLGELQKMSHIYLGENIFPEKFVISKNGKLIVYPGPRCIKFGIDNLQEQKINGLFKNSTVTVPSGQPGASIAFLSHA